MTDSCQSLDKLPWRECFGRTMKLIKNGHVGNKNNLYLVWTDLKHIYETKSSIQEIQNANSIHNPTLEVKSWALLLENINRCIDAYCDKSDADVAENMCGHNWQCSVSLALGKSRVRFNWEFEAIRQGSDSLFKLLTLPLLRNCQILAVEMKKRTEVIAAKDAEIEDMRLSGAKVSRKALETKLWIDGEIKDIDHSLCSEQLFSQSGKKDGSNSFTLPHKDSCDNDKNNSISSSIKLDTAPTGNNLKRSLDDDVNISIPLNNLSPAKEMTTTKKAATKIRKKKLGL